MRGDHRGVPFGYRDGMEVHGGGNRLQWGDLPLAVRSRIERLAGAPIRSASSAAGGFSPGLAATLALADGRSVFVKAIHAATGPGSIELYRREQWILTELGPHPRASRLLASDDEDDWVILVFEHVAGHHPQPGDARQRARMIDVFDRLAADLTPSPLRVESFADRVGAQFDGWRDVGHGHPAAQVAPWIERNLERVAAAAEGWRDAAAGSTLVHGDLRADNMLLTDAGAVVVDWTEACVGAAWLDWALAVPSLCLFPGTPPPSAVFAEAGVARSAPDGHVTAIVAAAAGYFLTHAVLPPIPALPTLRDFQRAQGLVAAAWLRARMGD
jgi:aminoglycoside phosphotransferase (APT) family kinase protein